MTGTALDVTAVALSLPQSERLALATRLLDSLQGPDDPDADAAWLVEMARRIREVDAGSVQTLSTEDVITAARAALERG